MMEFNIGLDLFPLLAGTLAAVTCGLLGNFLVLRRLSLMGDAISHSVLPGLVIAFLIMSTRNPIVMFAGAAVAGVATVILVELVKQLGRVEPGAAMGVVFSALFALGVLLIEQAAARHVDLDAECVLHGQLETLVWYGAPDTLRGLLQWSTIEAVPRQVTTLAIMCVLAILFCVLLFKELRIAAFDPALATTQGFHAGFLHYLLMVFVAAATVASFEAVGSILVIAMLVCPAAIARLLTDRLVPQMLVSVVAAMACGVGGYVAATAIPALFEKDSVNAAGSMSLVAGVLLAVAILGSPRHGMIARTLRCRALGREMAIDDLLGMLFRLSEHAEERTSMERLRALLPGRRLHTAMSTARRRGLISVTDAGLSLTPAGESSAREVIRRHRLWETYLVEKAGISADHVHDPAEHLEHLLVEPETGPAHDPHGKPIPKHVAPREEPTS